VAAARRLLAVQLLPVLLAYQVYQLLKYVRLALESACCKLSITRRRCPAMAVLYTDCYVGARPPSGKLPCLTEISVPQDFWWHR
jgi:hypothetical protein